ncbi:Unknown protein [Striga hermonthica]|uniref:Uncharacterized protein n=1 Tax=Striga hermonthica TaxID=68872 RepID=A0A9N7NBD1_STRHE|nr:Unknown protein [Striga hermonthica]
MIHTHHFIHAQIEHKTHVLLFNSKSPDFDSLLMHAREGRAEISKFKCHRTCNLQTSCNGLILEYEEPIIDNINLYISNPTIGKIHFLPPFVGGVPNLAWGIAYTSVSMAYKVVLPISTGQGLEIKFYILIVGVDKSWRAVDLGQMSIEAIRVFFFPPAITEGFIHWFHAHSNMVLTLNVETETVTKTPGPRPSRGIFKHQTNIYLSTGKFLSLLLLFGEFSWQVWEMRPENGEWRKTGSVCLES